MLRSVVLLGLNDNAEGDHADDTDGDRDEHTLWLWERF